MNGDGGGSGAVVGDGADGRRSETVTVTVVGRAVDGTCAVDYLLVVVGDGVG